MNATRICPLLLASLPLAGCVGLNSMVFATKTEFAVDLDSRPPTLNIGYGRKEVVIAPEFQDGQVHPLLTTIGSEGGAFNFVSDQSYATGDAAIVMADAFTSPVEYFADDPLTTGSKLVKLDGTHEAGRIRTKKSGDVEGFWGSLEYMFAGNEQRKRYFFGTDTLLGLNVEWSGAQVPTSIALGWKRKELSYIPLMETPAETPAREIDAEGKSKEKLDEQGRRIMVPAVNSKNEQLVDIRVPSLLATASAGIEIDTPSKTTARVAQTYATGISATLLAGHPGVREVLGSALVTDAKAIRDKAAEAQKEAKQLRSAMDLTREIRQRYDEFAATKQETVRREAIRLQLVPSETTANTFLSDLAAGTNAANKMKLGDLLEFVKK